MGKTYEKLLVTRLKYHILPKMSPRQYGLMPQRSTEDSLYSLMQYIRNKLKQKKMITLISLDIEGAFDSAWWPEIRVRLAEENCPLNLRRVIDSYLSDREVVVRKAAGICKQLTKAAKVSWGLHPEVVKTIYVATIEPVILYAASVWAPAAEKLTTRKKFEVIQRGIAQKQCGAYRTVSHNAALLLAGMLPLDLRVREAALLYEAKRGANLPQLGDREIERRGSALETPHPAEQTSIEFGILADQDALNKNEQYTTRIYTDGSKIGGRVGAALSIWQGDAETRAVKLALSDYCSVYQAELLALQEATSVALNSAGSSFGVYSDSRAALQTISNHRCLHPLAIATRENLTSISLQGKELSLFWIKAHAGLDGNERADQLAKEAAVASKRRPNYDLCPVSHIKRILRKDSLDVWNRRYVEGTTASTTKLFFPNAVEAYGVVRKMVPRGIITQVMTGHGGFSEYLNRFKCKENPSCSCEPGVPETIAHLLIECPQYGVQRFDLENKIDIKLTKDNIRDIMMGKIEKDL
ncbi:uncharacterized protein [Choristoneura fumiferana]|uniref:uncharacterized protein n=1 Tax=Choristoneura fumiferana TaxID=7141 RepID=UPI003D159765